MIDEQLRERINSKFRNSNSWRLKPIATAVVAYLFGAVSVFALSAFQDPHFSEDDLAKFAAIASCSTGKPAAVVWAEARRKVNFWSSTIAPDKFARDLLVHIDVNRCTLRQTANAHRDNGKLRTFPPRNQYD